MVICCLTDEAVICEGVKAPTGVGKDMVHGPGELTSFLCMPPDDDTKFVHSVPLWVLQIRYFGLRCQKKVGFEGR